MQLRQQLSATERTSWPYKRVQLKTKNHAVLHMALEQTIYFCYFYLRLQLFHIHSLSSLIHSLLLLESPSSHLSFLSACCDLPRFAFYRAFQFETIFISITYFVVPHSLLRASLSFKIFSYSFVWYIGISPQQIIDLNKPPPEINSSYPQHFYRYDFC